MTPLSGTACAPVQPTDAKEALEADTAEAGEVSATQARQRTTRTSRFETASVMPFRPPAPPQTPAEAEKQQQLTWIEISLVGEDDKPIPGERYSITLPDGTVAEGTLDADGTARVDQIKPGTCTIRFPDLDKEAWEAC